MCLFLVFYLTLPCRREKSATKNAFLIYPNHRNRQFQNRGIKANNAHLWYMSSVHYALKVLYTPQREVIVL